jgi:hypothetical protein
MTKEQALEFLRQHQLMPEDDGPTGKLLMDFEEVHRYSFEHPDLECIPLFLNAFSASMGLGVFQLCGDVFQQYDTPLITPHLIDVLRSNQKVFVGGLHIGQMLIRPSQMQTALGLSTAK